MKFVARLKFCSSSKFVLYTSAFLLFLAGNVPVSSYAGGPAEFEDHRIPIPETPTRSSFFSVGSGDNVSLLVDIDSAELAREHVAASGSMRTPMLQSRRSQDAELEAAVTGDSGAGTISLEGIPLSVVLVLVALIGLVPVARRGAKNAGL